MCVDANLQVYVCVHVYFSVRGTRKLPINECGSCNSSLMVLQVKVQWTVSWAGFMFLFLFLIPELARHWQSGSGFLWWSASIPVQGPSITSAHIHTHTCMHVCMHTNTYSAWNQDRFHVQGPSIIHGIFNVNRLLQLVTITDWSLRWAAVRLPPMLPFSRLSLSLSLSHFILQVILWHLLYAKSANDHIKWLE